MRVSNHGTELMFPCIDVVNLSAIPSANLFFRPVNCGLKINSRLNHGQRGAFHVLHARDTHISLGKYIPRSQTIRNLMLTIFMTE